MKRFYKLVSSQSRDGGFSICLDGKPVKTPNGAFLLAGSQDLADALVREWAAQGEKIDPETMPLTQILSTKIDRVSSERAAMTTALLKYLDTDLLCYRADDASVAEKQAALWDSVLEWFEKRFGASLETTNDLKALRQAASAHEKVAAFVNDIDDDRFTVLQLVTALGGSLVLALAFTEKELGAEEIFTAIHVEEDHKAEIYNEKLHGLAPHEEKRRASLRRDLGAAQTFLSTL